MEITVFCDGGARGNPGPAGIGVIIKDKNGEILSKTGKKIGVATNNIAEYTAVLEALIWVEKHIKPKKITFCLDSQLVVYQLNGLFKMKNVKLRELFMRIREKEGKVGGNITYRHIPREENYEADKLVNDALDA